jgi:SAM-dependent methyltransferase
MTDHSPGPSGLPSGQPNPNQAQIDYWSGPVAQRWVWRQGLIDAMMAPVTAALLGALGAVRGERVLDVGCGSGETALLLARQDVAVTGVDVSPQLLQLARERAQMLEARLGCLIPVFELADASAWRLAPDSQPFDALVSRFGVMFFAEPEAAFASLARAVKPGGRIVFACWRGPQENGWVQVPMTALAGLAEAGAASNPDAPGPFAFGREERLRQVLTDAGLTSIRLTPLDVMMPMGAPSGIGAAADFMAEIGPAARALSELPDAVKAEAKARLAAALLPHMTAQGQLLLGGAVWIVQAQVPG